MFHFAAYRLNWSYEFRPVRHRMNGAGFPHSEIFGSKRACRSPKLIAACCVLRRLMKPRHPSIAVTGLCKRSHILGVYLTHLHYKKTTLNFQRTKLVRSYISLRHLPLRLSRQPSCVSLGEHPTPTSSGGCAIHSSRGAKNGGPRWT